MSAKDFTPYWLIHEPGKDSGFAIVSLDKARIPAEAIEAWKTSDEARAWLRAGVDYTTLECEARLITEPFDGTRDEEARRAGTRDD